MSEENTEVQEQQQEQQEQQEAPDVNAELDKLRDEHGRMKAKLDELLGEKKAAAQKAREAEEARKKAEQEALIKSGDLDAIKKSYESKLSEATKRAEELQQNYARKELDREAIAIAADIADGPNAKILSRFIADRLRYDEDGVKILDKDGNLTIGSADDLKAEIQNDPDFASLVRGSRASGGSASNQSGSAGSKTIKRSDFDGLSQAQRAAHIRDGGKIID